MKVSYSDIIDTAPLSGRRGREIERECAVELLNRNSYLLGSRQDAGRDMLPVPVFSRLACRQSLVEVMKGRYKMSSQDSGTLRATLDFVKRLPP